MVEQTFYNLIVMSKKLKEQISKIDTDEKYLKIDINESNKSINSSISTNSLDDRLELEKINEFSSENIEAEVNNGYFDKIDEVKEVSISQNKIENINT